MLGSRDTEIDIEIDPALLPVLEPQFLDARLQALAQKWNGCAHLRCLFCFKASDWSTTCECCMMTQTHIWPSASHCAGVQQMPNINTWMCDLSEVCVSRPTSEAPSGHLPQYHYVVHLTRRVRPFPVGVLHSLALAQLMICTCAPETSALFAGAV